MSDFSTLLFTKNDSIAHIVLNRPEALNAFNVQMRDDLYVALQAIRDDDEITVVVISGAGEKAFCAGADLREFLSAPSPTAARQVRRYRDLWKLFLSLRQPFIAAVHGHVLGSGLEIALCCDLRIAAEGSIFGFPEITLGIIPAAGGTQTLPRVVGRSKALEMLLLNRWFDVEEALRAGLVNRVVSKEDLAGAAQQLAETIAAFDPAATQSAKKAIVSGLDMTLSEGIELERRLSSYVKTIKKLT